MEFEYKELQEVDTKRDIILFGVPADIDTNAFRHMVLPHFRRTMGKMRARNPSEYPHEKYGKDVPEFVVLSDWLFNAPYQDKSETEGIPFWCKKCIQFKTKDEDHEILWNILNYMGLTKQDRSLFGEFDRFVKGPGVGAGYSNKQPLGQLLQYHIAIVRSMAKTPLPGLLYPDLEHVLNLAPDKEKEAREPVTISIWQILMKKKIGLIHVWQCILPWHGGGWEGYYANGKGCDIHRVEALTWSDLITAHIRFHLLKRGVEVSSMEDVINLSFTLNAALEAFGAKLIGGKVFTAGSASAMSMARDLKGTWVDLGLGNSAKKKEEKETYSRRGITLRTNTDPTAFNFSGAGRFPGSKDTGSIVGHGGCHVRQQRIRKSRRRRRVGGKNDSRLPRPTRFFDQFHGERPMGKQTDRTRTSHR